MSTLASPKAVSPFIRFSRWGFLITGVLYGHFHFKYLSRKEAKIQANYEPIRQKREAHLAKEREAKMKDEMDVLGREAGVVKKSEDHK